MRKVLFGIIFCVFANRGFTQEVEIVQKFAFNEEIPFYSEWDPNEGGSPGILSMLFIDNTAMTIADADSRNWFIYNQNLNLGTIQNKTFGISGLEKVQSGYLIIGTLSKDGELFIFDINLLLQKSSDIWSSLVYKINADAYYKNLYLTGNMLFAETSRGDLVSWELLGNGENKYRNIEETTAWLTDGNAEKVGYRRDNSIPITYFGDFTMTFDAPLNYINWQDYIFPEGEFENIDFLNGYIGTDEKGLSYFKMKYPLNRQNLLSMEPFQFAIAILDTWTKKVYFRVYPAGTWDPPRTPNPNPRNTKPELIARLAWAVHPNGDVYFFDADVDKQEYQLKKLTNDWWAEIGIEERRIGRIEQNYIPLQQEASVTADNNGYNYEREFVWILEESTKTETVDGKTVPWVKVRKLDGREGWILLSDVYF